MSVETPELRADKYNAEQMKELAAKGHTFKAPDGTHDYPIDDAEDLGKAIKAVGRGNASHDAIRKYIIGRAKALGLSREIPDNWNADGSLKTAARSAVSMGRKKERHRAVPLIHEVRVYATEGLEIREADTAGNLVTITGAPIVYDKWYSVVDRRGEFQERMLPGVAKDVITGDTRFLFNHDGLPLARTVAGTLVLDDTPAKLKIGATVDVRQSLANDLVIAVERGDVTDMSVGFLADQDKWNATRDERSVHHFKSMPDVSAVTYPASPTTHLEIAQRMAQAAGVEPGARIRRLYADYRAGAVLNAKVKGQVIDAVKGLHSVLQSAGFDPAELIEGAGPSDDVDEVNDVGELTDGPMGANADASVGGDPLPVGDAAGPDGRAAEVDPGESMRVDETELEDRNAPTPEDWDIAHGLANLKATAARVKAQQLADPDYKTDPDDQAVMEWIEKAEAAIDGAIIAQSKDGHRDPKPEGERSAAALSELRAQYRAREYRQRTAA